MINRLGKFIQNQGISVRAFEMSIKASDGLIRRALNNNTDIQSKWIVAIADNYPQLSLDWLIAGRGEMIKSDDLYINKNDDDLITIPVVDVSAAAGHGFFNPDYPEKTGEIKLPPQMLRKRAGNYYCGFVHGDSMYPTLLDRDYIIFRLLHPNEWISVKDGCVYFIVDRFGTSYVKRIINMLKEENLIVCTSDNKEADFPDFNIMRDEIGNMYHVECKFSNNIEKLNMNNMQFKNDIEAIRAELNALKANKVQHSL